VGVLDSICGPGYQTRSRANGRALQSACPTPAAERCSRCGACSRCGRRAGNAVRRGRSDRRDETGGATRLRCGLWQRHGGDAIAIPTLHKDFALTLHQWFVGAIPDVLAFCQPGVTTISCLGVQAYSQGTIWLEGSFAPAQKVPRSETHAFVDCLIASDSVSGMDLKPY